MIYTPQRDCLLLERVRPAGFWQSVTGSLQWGEAVADAAAREVREETGLEPAGLRDAGIRCSFPILREWRARFAPQVRENVEYLWYLEIPEPVEIELNAREHCAYRWLPLADAIDEVSSWTNREALERLVTRGR